MALNWTLKTQGMPAHPQDEQSRMDGSLNIDTLPARLRDYIRLQHEMTGRDVGQNPFFLSPDTITDFAQDTTRKVEKERKKHGQWWYEFLMMQIKLFSEIFSQTWTKIEQAYEQLESMEDKIDDLEQMDGFPVHQKSPVIRQQIQNAKADLRSYQQQLLRQPEPTEYDMMDIQDKIDDRMEEIQQSFMNFNSLRKKAQTMILASTACAYHSSEKFLKRRKKPQPMRFSVPTANFNAPPPKKKKPSITEINIAAKPQQPYAEADIEYANIEDAPSPEEDNAPSSAEEAPSAE